MMEKEKNQIRFKEIWIVLKYKNDKDYREGKSYQVLIEVFKSGVNCMLNAGIAELWNLVIGGSALHLDNTNAQIGVGSDATAAVATQTDLQDAGAEWATMEATYPSISNQKVTFAGSFGDGEAEFHWQECAVRYGAAGTVFNRVVADKGTKAAGETWVAKLEITGS